MISEPSTVSHHTESYPSLLHKTGICTYIHVWPKSEEIMDTILVGGFNPSEKYAHHFPNFRGENNKKMKPPTSFSCFPPKTKKKRFGRPELIFDLPQDIQKIDTIPTISTFKACNFCFKLRSGKAPSIQPLIHPAQTRHPGIIQRTMGKQLGLCVWNLETMLRDRLMWYGWWFRNPKQPVDMVNIALFRRFYICQVVKDFFHRQYGQQLFGIMFFLCLPLRESDILSLSLKVLSWGFTWNQNKNHQIRKGRSPEPNLHLWVPAVTFPVCILQKRLGPTPGSYPWNLVVKLQKIWLPTIGSRSRGSLLKGVTLEGYPLGN